MISINIGWMDNHGRSLSTFSAYQAGQSFMWISMSWWPVVAPTAIWRTHVNRNMSEDVDQQDVEFAASREVKLGSN